MRSPEKLEKLLHAGIKVASIRVVEKPNPRITFELYYQPEGFFADRKNKGSMEDKVLNSLLDYDKANPGNEWSLWPEDTEYHYVFTRGP